jgi:long-chain alkane monooxygenase
MPREIRLNAFDMACIGHIQHGMWTHPRDKSTDYRSLDHWVSLARTLERGLFDGLFLADVLGVYDVYEGRPDASLRGAVQVPLIDPMLLVPAMAHATTHLGFGVTCNLAYEPPYLFARRMSSLDHLTNGRIGWNIVTGYLDSAARGMGFDVQMAHDDRYDLAEEYMQVVYALWEGSWQDDAVLSDRAGGVYADPARVRSVRHQGQQYRLDAIHLCEPSPQRTPVLYQAGASEREAREKLAEYRRCASVEGALAHAAASLGIDFARFGMDEPIDGSASQAIRSNVEAMARAIGPGWTKRDLIDRFVLGSRQLPIVGDPEQVADGLIAWVEEADVDGFNLSRTVMPECLEDFIALVVPVLQERGCYKRAYGAGTYREKLFGVARLAAPHPAVGFRVG